MPDSGLHPWCLVWYTQATLLTNQTSNRVSQGRFCFSSFLVIITALQSWFPLVLWVLVDIFDVTNLLLLLEFVSTQTDRLQSQLLFQVSTISVLWLKVRWFAIFLWVVSLLPAVAWIVDSADKPVCRTVISSKWSWVRCWLRGWIV